jgi:hypothetical protein
MAELFENVLSPLEGLTGHDEYSVEPFIHTYQYMTPSGLGTK